LQETLAALDATEPKKGKASKRAAPAKGADGNPLRQAQALVGALGRRTDGRPAVVRALVPLIQRADQHLWPTTYHAIRSLGPSGKVLLTTLVEMLKADNGDPSVRVIGILEAFPPAEREAAIPALAKFVEDRKAHKHARLSALGILCAHADTHNKAALQAGRAA